jgi:hypothetical protein
MISARKWRWLIFDYDGWEEILIYGLAIYQLFYWFKIQVLLREEAQSVKFIFQKVANSVPMLICGEVAAPKRKRLVSFYCKVLELRLRAVIQVGAYIMMLLSRTKR